MNGCLDSFLSCLNAATSVQETWAEAVLFMKSLGFDLIVYGYGGVGTDGPEIKVETLSNFPAAYQDRYRQERYHFDDPVVHHCVGSLSPLRVGRDSLHLWPGQGRSLTAIQRRIVNEAAECGMAVGVAEISKGVSCVIPALCLLVPVSSPEPERKRRSPSPSHMLVPRCVRCWRQA